MAILFFFFWLADISEIFSETTLPNGTKLYRQHLWEVLYKDSSFHLDPTTSMATTCYSCFWLADISKLFSPETVCPNVMMLDRKSRLLTDILTLSGLRSCEQYRLTWASSFFSILLSVLFSQGNWCCFFNILDGTFMSMVACTPSLKLVYNLSSWISSEADFIVFESSTMSDLICSQLTFEKMYRFCGLWLQ